MNTFRVHQFGMDALPEPTRPVGLVSVQSRTDAINLLRDPEARAALVRACEDNRAAVLAALPFVAAEIAGRTSFDALFKLIAARGGRQFYFPAKPDGTVIERIVGPDAAAMLCQLFGGDYAELPTARTIVTAIPSHAGKVSLKHRIRSLLAAGVNAQETAAALGCSARYVYKVRAADGAHA